MVQSDNATEPEPDPAELLRARGRAVQQRRQGARGDDDVAAAANVPGQLVAELGAQPAVCLDLA